MPSLNPEIYKILEDIAKTFYDKGAVELPHKFIIVTGGLGAGKTTLRRSKYRNGYVNFDPWEIFLAVESKFGKINETDLSAYSEIAADIILSNALENHRNTVIEIIGDQIELKTFIDQVSAKNYKVEIEYVHSDPATAYERHLKAIAEDKDYMPSAKTEKALWSYLYEHFKINQKVNTFEAKYLKYLEQARNRTKRHYDKHKSDPEFRAKIANRQRLYRLRKKAAKK